MAGVEDRVVVVSTEMVQARNCKDQPQRIELTPWDLPGILFVGMQQGLVFLKPEPSTSEIFGNTFAEHLKKSLSCTLDFFFPLAGRMAMVEHDVNDDGDDHSSDRKRTQVSFYIDCNNQGAQFVHAVADHVTVADVLEPFFIPSFVHSFFPLNDVYNYDVYKPLLGIQVTELVDGIFVACTMNHCVADGLSFWNFFNSWSKIARQLGPVLDQISVSISMPPVFDRSFFGNTCSFPIQIPFSLNGFKIDREKAQLASASASAKTSTILERKVFNFSKTKIAELKARANAKFAGLAGGSISSSSNGNIITISSFQSLVAHVWRFMLRNRGVNPTEKTCLFFAIDNRSRLQGRLPEEYFGNAIVIEILPLTVKEIIDDDGYATALHINKVVASSTPDRAARNLESWIQNPTLLGEGGESLPNLFVVVNSPRFNVYGNDFGWGKPVAVRNRPLKTVDGLLTLFPGVEEGSIDIEICSTSKSLQIMANDPDFNYS